MMKEDRTINAAFIHCQQLDELPYPASSPFNTSRAGQVRDLLKSMGLLSGENHQQVEPDPADRKALLNFHTAKYLDALSEPANRALSIETYRMGIGTPDCPAFEGMYEYSALACGASLKGAQLILSGQANVAFNPSGGLHHAHAGRASGFCYMNDVAIACKHLAENGKRVVYLDIDAHHGDGVQEAFYNRSDVMTISLHESGRTLFPGTGFENEIGSADAAGYSVNVPLPAGIYDEAYLDAFDQTAAVLMQKFDPDVIVLQLGMDGLAGDPLTHLNLTNNTHAAVIERVMKFNKPVLAAGGGGYNIPNTVRAWALAWTALCGTTAEDLRDKPLTHDESYAKQVDAQLAETLEKLKTILFPIHGL